ncbi:MAG TPA: sigma-54 dependent transcriptional regulator [Bryobacteraceae bacterium]|nr:sigma-54 dependent transcriptional regulator [Bryobacteraceae bacterium]
MNSHLDISPETLGDDAEAVLSRPYLVTPAAHPDESAADLAAYRPAMKWKEELGFILAQVSPFDVPVLIQGETGAGKEVVARMLHARSTRRNQQFLKLNCAALPSELIESELFGYERGAFTGANKSTPGKFELANGGTIFLDEIGDMDVSLQAKLLQVLQDREFLPLGAREPIKVDVRVIAATHRDLEEAIERGEFREDLYYRLDVFNIKVPALRERPEEIIELARMFLEKHAHPELGFPVITPQLRKTLLAHTWPGNVRELENLMRRFLIYRDPAIIERELTRRMGSRRTSLAAGQEPGLLISAPLKKAGGPTIEALRHNRNAEEAHVIVSVLESTRWNRKQAARQLGMDYKALLYRMKRLGIDGTRESPSSTPNDAQDQLQ